MTKEFERAWRPSLRVVAVLISGVLEAFYVLDCDLKGDSNMEMSLLVRSLDLVAEELRSRGLPLPAHLVSMGDNTGKELRNQGNYKFHNFLVARNLFVSTTIAHPTAGLSHGKCDQRFSIMGASL